MMAGVDGAGSKHFEDTRTAKRRNPHAQEVTTIKPSTATAVSEQAAIVVSSSLGELQQKRDANEHLTSHGSAGREMGESGPEREMYDFLKTDRSSRMGSGASIWTDDKTDQDDAEAVEHCWEDGDLDPIVGIAPGDGRAGNCCPKDDLRRSHEAPPVGDEHPDKRASDRDMPTCFRSFLASEGGSSLSDTESGVGSTKDRRKACQNSPRHGKDTTVDGRGGPAAKSIERGASSGTRFDEERVPPVGNANQASGTWQPDVQLAGRSLEANTMVDEHWEVSHAPTSSDGIRLIKRLRGATTAMACVLSPSTSLSVHAFEDDVRGQCSWALCASPYAGSLHRSARVNQIPKYAKLFSRGQLWLACSVVAPYKRASILLFLNFPITFTYP